MELGLGGQAQDNDDTPATAITKMCVCVRVRARVCVWGARMSSRALLLSQVQIFAAPWTVAHQAPLSVGFSR